jgi:hypothetical protein
MPIKAGSVAHAKLVLAAECIVSSDDIRWPKSTINALIKGANTWKDGGPYWAHHISYPHPTTPVHWFDADGDRDQGALALRQEGLL